MKLFLGIFLGYFFKSKWYDTNCFEKLKDTINACEKN
jgi:hypothetical protein